VLSEWKNHIEDKKLIITVFIDLRRAFETIDRELLLRKMRNYKFSEKTIEWFRSYLTGRKQQTKIGISMSKLRNCDVGCLKEVFQDLFCLTCT
jgi:hypothetical protein